MCMLSVENLWKKDIGMLEILLKPLLRQPKSCIPRSWSVLTLFNRFMSSNLGVHGSGCLKNS